MTNRQTISCNSFDGVFDTFPDKAFCILSHCDTEKKISLLNLMIEDIRSKFDLPILIEWQDEECFTTHMHIIYNYMNL